MPSTASSTASTKVQLTVMSLFHGRGEGAARDWVPLVGTRHIAVAGGQVLVEAASIPFHTRSMDARSPAQGGLLTLFGIRDALAELQHWRTVARNSKAEFAYLQLQVEVGEAARTAVTRRVLREMGPALRFLHVRRSAAEFQKELLQQFAQWVQAEGGDAARDMGHVRQMAQRPDLFARVLREDPDLQHIDVMVLPLADRADAAQVRQVAFLRAGAAWTELTQGNDQFRMHLPAWMASRQPSACSVAL